jgi:hypothetical protein
LIIRRKTVANLFVEFSAAVGLLVVGVIVVIVEYITLRK